MLRVRRRAGGEMVSAWLVCVRGGEEGIIRDVHLSGRGLWLVRLLVWQGVGVWC